MRKTVNMKYKHKKLHLPDDNKKREQESSARRTNESLHSNKRRLTDVGGRKEDMKSTSQVLSTAQFRVCSAVQSGMFDSR
jgi:hypothetical protein